MRRPRSYVLGAALLAFGLLLGACGPGEDAPPAGSEEPVERGALTVGSDGFYEAQIVGAMYALVLEDAGYDVTTELNIDSREVRLPAMESGEIDIAPEYLASLASVLDPENTEPVNTPEAALEVLEPLVEEKGLTLLEPSDAVDVNAFVVTQETADEHGLTAVSDLAPVAGDLVLGAPPECPKRPYCIPGLKDVYGVEFGDFKPLEYGTATVQALTAGAIDVALLFSTDPLIEENDLVLLEDDMDLQAADNLTPMVRTEILNDEIESLLNEVSALLTTDNITPLNAQVLVDQEDPEDVARGFLEENGLL
ncbi:MAG: ABC transporter substrate-binding protein [Actinomycetota bacterium]|nr:ABC transporter substrate-binding protein [Actinomycetota bacterium]